MELFIGIIVFAIGLCMGSFVNMLIYRTARRYKLKKSLKSKVKNSGRSFCDGCGRQLKWYENIPMVSWVIQGGKSRCCGKKLDRSYPLVELLTGVLSVIQYIIFQNDLRIVIGLVIITLLVFLAVFDIKYMILPDVAVYLLILVGVAGVVFDESNIIPYLLSALGASGFLGILHLATKGKGMGLGDVKYAVFMGLWLGPVGTVVAFYVAFVMGAVFGLVMMVAGRMGRKSLIAFGPFLILGTMIAMWWGNGILKIVGLV